MDPIEEFKARLAAAADRIFVRAKIDDRWRSVSLKELEEHHPIDAAFWRGVFCERFHQSGGKYFPVVVKDNA